MGDLEQEGQRDRHNAALPRDAARGDAPLQQLLPRRVQVTQQSLALLWVTLNPSDTQQQRLTKVISCSSGADMSASI